MKNLPKFIFYISLLLIIFLTVNTYLENYYSTKEYSYYNQKALQENNPVYCERVSNFRYAAMCYSSFVQGYSCTTDPCYFAYALYIKDDWYCDKAFPHNVPLNLECRVSVFIERYTNEGLSDCCHIK